ncbi:MAG: hypothetical protein HFJ34_03310 [Clostridia bacterium]|nr:hypothetical protein [Clostridia bacterium]
MEILNNINELISNNNLLYKIPFTFIEMHVVMLMFLTLLNISTTKKSKLLYVSVSAFITLASNFLIPSPFNVFINYILYFLLIMAIFKISPLKSLIALVCFVTIFAIISSLVLNPYLTLLNINKEILSNIPIYHIGFLTTVYTINYLLVLTLKIRNLKLNLFEDIDKKNKYVVFANFIFGIFTLIVQACIIFYYIDTLPIIITFLSCISLLAYFGISIYSLTSVMKLTLTRKKLESAEEYNKTLRILHDNVRGFKHDFDNIVTTIGGYVRTNDMKGLENYYVQLEDDCQRVNNLYLLNPEIINNPRYI